MVDNNKGSKHFQEIESQMKKMTSGMDSSVFKRIREEQLEILKNQTELNDIMGEQTDVGDEVLGLNKEILGQMSERLVLAMSYGDLEKEELDKLREKVGAGETLAESEEERYNLLLDVAELGEEGLERLKEEARELSKTVQASEKHVKSKEKLLGLLGGVASKLGMASSYQETWTARIGESLSSMGELKSLMSMENFAAGLIMLAESLLQKVVESSIVMANQVDALRVSLTSLGVGGEVVADQMYDLWHSMGYGFYSTEELGKSYEELYKSMSKFSSMTREAQGGMVSFVASANRLGFDRSSLVLQTFQKTLGETVDGSKQSMADLRAQATSLGISVSEYGQSFVESMKTLGVHGEGASKEFVRLSAVAKKAGVEVSGVLSLVEQFDTFEGAATAVGKLNYMMGGPYLNAMEMVMATESERIDLMSKTIAASGKSWESMSRYERKMFMTTLGIKDMNLAISLLNGELSGVEFEQMEKDAAAAGMSIDEFNRLGRENVDIITQLKEGMLGFAAVLEPIWMIGKALAWAVKWMGEWSWVMGATMLVIGIFVKKTLAAAGAKIGAIYSEVAAKNSLIRTNRRLLVSQRSLNKVSLNPMMLKGLAAMALVIASIGASIWMVTKGFSNLADSISRLKSMEQINALMGVAAMTMGMIVLVLAILIPIIYALGVAGTAGAIGLAVLALTFLSIGASVWLITQGMKSYTDSQTKLISESAKLGDSFGWIDKVDEAVSGVWALTDALVRLSDEVGDGIELGELSSQMSKIVDVTVEGRDRDLSNTYGKRELGEMVPVAMSSKVESLEVKKNLERTIKMKESFVGGGRGEGSGVSSDVRVIKGPITCVLELDGRKFGQAVEKSDKDRKFTRGSLQSGMRS